MRSVAAAALAGAALFLGCSSLPLVGLWDHKRDGDIHYYRHYGELVRHGEVPYRDFYLEYPPGAVPLFVVPTPAGTGYTQAFRIVISLIGAATVPLLATALRGLGASTRRIWACCLFAGLAPLLLGPVYVVNYDAWPAFLTAAALALVAWGRRRSGAAVLGLGFATKVYPVVLLPLLLVRAWREGGLRSAAWSAAAFGAAAGAAILPLAAIAPGGVGFSLYVQAKRPLQIESLGASLLLVAHQLGLYGGSVNSNYNSQNLNGSLASGLAAAVVGYVAFGKILSPQYLIWLVPVVLLVDELLPAALLGVALVLTHVWFPDRYENVVSFGALGWLVFARDQTLVALFAVLLRPAAALAVARLRAPQRVPSPTG
jgi:hypothetical protein